MLHFKGTTYKTVKDNKKRNIVRDKMKNIDNNEIEQEKEWNVNEDNKELN